MGNSNELLTLKRNALRLGLCGEYKGKWDSAASKRELINMALDSNGIEFMADSIAFGWGLSKEYLLKEFGEFANGFYQCNEHGYTSEMYIGALMELSRRALRLFLSHTARIWKLKFLRIWLLAYMCAERVKFASNAKENVTL